MTTDQIMAKHIRAYRKEGKSEKWLTSWKRGFYMVGRRIKSRKTK